MIVFSAALYLPKLGDGGPTDNSIDLPLICYDDQVTTTNVSAGTTTTGFPATNLANPSTAARWQANDTTTQYLTVDLPLSPVVDYLAMARHNLHTAGITVSVEAQLTSGGSWTQLTTPQVLADDLPTIFRFVPAPYFGVRLKLLTGGTTTAQVSVLYVGKSLPVPRKVYVGHSPSNLSRTATVTNGRSESGQFLGRIVTGETVSSAMTLANLDPAWYRTNFDPFVKASRDTPFFLAWRPGAYPLETAFAWMTNSPVPVNQLSNGMMSVSIQYGGIA